MPGLCLKVGRLLFGLLTLHVPNMLCSIDVAEYVYHLKDIDFLSSAKFLLNRSSCFDNDAQRGVLEICFLTVPHKCIALERCIQPPGLCMRRPNSNPCVVSSIILKNETYRP
ncbi:hypothetical protein EV356DRAFT_32711 [Viridothelium virens]|uniref:Secreted protein n=1 Tax=Viridothelium virens TaxID=1048519 RepID=A0A6A6GTA9_VIRVR|nr:hypothetical protein EV356DRAFT_32711 [Viridothelium virens]